MCEHPRVWRYPGNPCRLWRGNSPGRTILHWTRYEIPCVSAAAPLLAGPWSVPRYNQYASSNTNFKGVNNISWNIICDLCTWNWELHLQNHLQNQTRRILWKSALNRVDTLNSSPAHLTKSSLMFSARHTMSSSLLISSRGVSIFKCNCCFVVGNRNNIYYLLYLWQPVYGVVSRIVVLQCFVSSKSIVNLDKFVHGCSAWAFDECVFWLWAEDVLISLEKKSFHGLENMFVHHWVIHSKSVNNIY